MQTPTPLPEQLASAISGNATIIRPPPSTTEYELSKLAILMRSRKFWSAVAGLAIDLFGVINHTMTYQDGVTGAIAILGFYIAGVTVEDHGAAQAQATIEAARLHSDALKGV